MSLITSPSVMWTTAMLPIIAVFLFLRPLLLWLKRKASCAASEAPARAPLERQLRRVGCDYKRPGDHARVPVFRGIRVTVQTPFHYLAGGETLEDSLNGFRTVPAP